jgi:hypothetical protein
VIQFREYCELIPRARISPQAEAVSGPLQRKVLQWARDSDGLLPALPVDGSYPSQPAADGRLRKNSAASGVGGTDGGGGGTDGGGGGGGGVLRAAASWLAAWLLPCRLRWLLCLDHDGGGGGLRRGSGPCLAAAGALAEPWGRVEWAGLKGSGRAFEKVTG